MRSGTTLISCAFIVNELSAYLTADAWDFPEGLIDNLADGLIDQTLKVWSPRAADLGSAVPARHNLGILQHLSNWNRRASSLETPVTALHSRHARVFTSSLLVPGQELPRNPPASSTYPGPLSSEQVAEFFENGVLVVRGLLKGEQLERAQQRSFNKSAMGNYEHLGLDAWKTHEDPFLEIATKSPLVEVAAQLTPNAAEEGLYVLKDAFFLAVGKNEGCGWHVDDPVFWPASQQHKGPGVNIWVVLDEVTEEGGGLAVAPGSHREEFLPARAAIRNENGEINTCAMADIAPEWNAKLEAIKEVPMLKPGDAIIQTRYLFHRMDPFVEGSESQRGPGVARYSVRYVPGNARLDGGFAKLEAGFAPVHGEIRHAAANGFPVFPAAVMENAVEKSA